MAYERFRHRLRWNGRPVAGFTTMSTLTGAATGAARLEHGVTHDGAFAAWASDGAADDAARVDVVVETFDEAGRQVGSVTLRRCRVDRFQALPDLDAAANAFAVEVISFQYEGVGPAEATGASAAGAIADVSAALRDLLRAGLADVRLPGAGGEVPVRLAAPPAGPAGLQETALHVFLHRVVPNASRSQVPPRTVPDGGRTPSGPALDLHYLVCVSTGDELHTELLLGAAALALHRSPVLSVHDSSVPVVMESPSVEDLAAAARVLGGAAPPLLAYRASVVLGEDVPPAAPVALGEDATASAEVLPMLDFLTGDDGGEVLVVDRPIRRIDLGRVGSRWTEETERELDAVFDEAERSGAVLILDEADALFGKRTEVGDAHDRYADMETNYLLQRLESFPGLVIVTTGDGGASIDPDVLHRLRKRPRRKRT